MQNGPQRKRVEQLRIGYDTQGRVIDAVVESAEPDLKVFKTAALDAAKDWRFIPEQIQGRGVAGSVQIPVQFEFEGPHVGEVKFPDGGTLAVRKTTEAETESQSESDQDYKLAESRFQLRSIGPEPDAAPQATL